MQCTKLKPSVDYILDYGDLFPTKLGVWPKWVSIREDMLC